MRFLIKVSIPVDAGNAAIKSGSLPRNIDSILAKQKPEAAYFYEENGNRTGLICVNLQDASEIPAIAEPWFLAFDANVEFHPVMTPDDLKRALPAIEDAVKEYGSIGKMAAG